MPINVQWTVVPNGIENGKLKLALLASIKLSSASTAETTLGASFPAILNWHKNKFSFVITFAGAMGVKTFNIGPVAVPSQVAWPSTFKSDTPVKPYKYEPKFFKAFDSYSVSRLLESTETAYAEVTAGALGTRYTGVEDLIRDQFKAQDIYRSPFFQPRENIGTVPLPGRGGLTLPGIRPPENEDETFGEELWASSDFGTALVGSAKEMMAAAFASVCDEWRNNGGEMPEESALWWEARNFFEAYDRHEEDDQATIQARPGVIQGRPVQIRPDIAANPQRIPRPDRYAGRPMAVVTPKLDFHEALALLGEHPALMRQFGLIFDVEVPVANASLAPTGSVGVAVSWTTDGGGNGSSAENPLTVFQFQSASGIFLPAHKPGAEYRQGFYNLGSEYVQITGVDVDSLAIRVLDFAGTIRSKYALYSRTSVAASPNPPSLTARPPATAAPASRPPAGGGTTAATGATIRPGALNPSILQPQGVTPSTFRQAPHQMVVSEALWSKMGDRPDTAAPPGLRSAGVSIARKDRSMKIAATMAVADANMLKMAAPKTVSLYFEDMIRGYRMDVFHEGQWHSLTTRKGGYTLPGNVAGPTTDEESWVSAVASTDPQDRAAAAADKAKIHEVMVRWQGFSQVCQRPGKTADQQGNLIDGNTQLDPRFPIRMQFAPRPGSLPILRFGKQYRFRLRLSTVAGTGPEIDASSPGAPFETPALTYRRWESVSSPTLHEQAQTKEGESANHLVIRKYVANPNQIDPAVRQLAPPSGEVSLCETHGMFDKDGKPEPAMYAKIQERDNMAELPKFVGSKINRFPYFADPMALGVTIQGAPHSAAPLALAYPGSWPEQQSLTVEVRAGQGASAASGEKFTLNLIPGEIAFPKISSNTKVEHNELFGIMEWVPPARRAAVVAAVHQGRVWTITPFRETQVVYATQIPEQKPSPDRPYATRSPGGTRAIIGGRLQTHSWTTSSVDFNAKWTDECDFIEEARRTTETQDKNGNAFKLKIVRGPTAPVVFQPFTEDQEFGDTKHHEVTFDLVGHSPFKQYFPASWPLASNPEGTRFTETREDAFKVHVPASTRPATPQVEYVVPTFGWSLVRATDGKSLTSSRDGNGLRVYLRRPWFSSGNGEKLAVVFLSASSPSANPKIDAMTTRAGADPVFRFGDVPANFGPGNFVGGGTAVGSLGAPDVSSASATVVPYPVHFDADRQMWYADITINAGFAYTPFVRLALARYQQYALPGLNLSGIVVADIMQIQMDRSASVVFNDASNRVTAALVGVAGESAAGPNQIFGTIQEKVGPDDDTGWRTVTIGGKELTRKIPIRAPGNLGSIAIPAGRLTNPGTLIRPPARTVPPPGGGGGGEDETPRDDHSEAEGQGNLRQGTIQNPPIRPGILNPAVQPQIKDIVAAAAGEGEFTLPGPRSQKTYRLVIREYEVFASDSGEMDMPDLPTAATANPLGRAASPTVPQLVNRPEVGARLVYMDVIPLS